MTEDEISEARELFVTNNLELSKQNDLLQDAKHYHKTLTKPLKEINKSLLQDLKTRSREVTGTVYLLRNLEENVMDYVNDRGNIVFSRRLKPIERQGNVFHMNRAANDL